MGLGIAMPNFKIVRAHLITLGLHVGCDWIFLFELVFGILKK
jgi:hypothetical protein